MITAREDILNGTRESILEWGFSVEITYKVSGKVVPDIPANGRKASIDIDSQGMQIVNNNPYLAIAIEDLPDGIPEKGSTVKAPLDFFKPTATTVNYAVDRASKTDDDWFVKIYLTKAVQVTP